MPYIIGLIIILSILDFGFKALMVWINTIPPSEILVIKCVAILLLSIYAIKTIYRFFNNPPQPKAQAKSQHLSTPTTTTYRQKTWYEEEQDHRHYEKLTKNDLWK